jgi:hypothetical protein
MRPRSFSPLARAPSSIDRTIVRSRPGDREAAGAPPAVSRGGIMQRHATHGAAFALALAFSLVPWVAADAQEHAHPTITPKGPAIPEALRVEHAEIHGELVRATKVRGRVGVAARALATVLDPHFEREEQIALPPLGLLAPLARGDDADAMRAILPLTDSLRAELPAMLEEHKAIAAATRELQRVARAAGNARVAALAEKLLLHARNEEEITYPAALLVGEVVRARTAVGVR